MTGDDHLLVKRAFLTVDNRQVHLRYMGMGPPALFIHSSPTNSSFVLDDMRAQAEHYTCFAFDTPGFGLSDPLPLETMKVADLADAVARAMQVLGLPPLPVFGTHSGAAIALELGYRHPKLVTGLMLDGVPVFTQDEVEPLRGAYFAPLVVDVLGGQFSATWTRFRDQNMWFPWCFRRPENLNEYDLAPPENTHMWTDMFFAAAAHYKPAYLAVTSYCDGAVEAAAGLTVPAVFTATETDMLYPHLDRLPPLRENQSIAQIGTSYARKRILTGEAFAKFGSPGEAPGIAQAFSGSSAISKQFFMDDGRAMKVRTIGDRANPALLILHDAPGSSRMVEAQMLALSADYFVCAPDIPGSGDSEALDESADMSAYAQVMWRLCDAAGLDLLAIRGLGLGASLAVEMVALMPARCSVLSIDGLLLADPIQRAELRQNFAPPVEIGRDGSHWYRLWLMLRDSLVYWPWYDSRRVALRRAPTVFEPEPLHEWAVEVMKQGKTYHHYIQAALRHDAASALQKSTVPVAVIDDPLAALGAAYGAQLKGILADRNVALKVRKTA